MQALFEKMKANRRLAIAVIVAGTLLFMLASASRQGAGGSALVELFSSLCMVVGVVMQFLGLAALLKGPRR
ncbi:hypothetical protein [Vogesella sp. LIG4]|uniref:hypothetical protein n=1 Tax=Vogesella sp. LIG4 TaxID=1192162 RepID=UPI00081FE196|nr:hypothetical protein [Vogesella sp. LIG4]SCK28540.1 hypothetical protein PSELUDRAFT_3496 [Vogesella sp. LIG4]